MIPQMNPMLWLILYISCVLILLFFIVNLNYIFFRKSSHKNFYDNKTIFYLWPF